MVELSIDPAVFALEPDFKRGVVVVRLSAAAGVDARLEADLRVAEAQCRERLEADTIASHPHLLAWRSAFRKFGANPTEYRPSVDAIVRRVIKGASMPSIHPLVDIGTILSLRNVLPVGVHPISEGQALCLRLARHGDDFQPPTGDPEQPGPAEVVYATGSVILTRRWAWRQSRSSLVQPTTLLVEFNLDVLPPFGSAEVMDTADQLIALLARFADSRTEFALLDANSPSATLMA